MQASIWHNLETQSVVFKISQTVKGQHKLYPCFVFAAQQQHFIDASHCCYLANRFNTHANVTVMCTFDSISQNKMQLQMLYKQLANYIICTMKLLIKLNSSHLHINNRNIQQNTNKCVSMMAETTGSKTLTLALISTTMISSQN